ncbi:MAG: Rpn family recombination-promoting nuclease/putative transposase [Lachnospiraceae bacterium]|nr:Rpn family recombination-promoting nuclease/putative transposase [Lachnospiraceae bacterium]
MSRRRKLLFENATGPVDIPMTNDFLFKMLLQENEQVLKALICSLLHRDPESVTELTVINPIIPGRSVGAKEIILDVNVAFNHEARIDLEMQVVNQYNWTERSLYYTCRNFTRLEQGDNFSRATPSIHIGLLDYTLFTDHPVFYSTYRLMDETGYLYSDKFIIGVVDLTRINLATDTDRRYNIDKWAQLFKSATWEDVKMLARQDVNIRQAAETMYRLSAEDAIREEARGREDYYRCQRDVELHMQELQNALAESKEQLSQKDDQIARLEALVRDLQKNQITG